MVGDEMVLILWAILGAAIVIVIVAGIYRVKELIYGE